MSRLHFTASSRWAPSVALSRRCVHLGCIAALAIAALGTAQAQVNPQICGNTIHATYGPFDYRSATKFQRDIVENAHFTPEVESLLRGKTNNHVGPDLAYTLSVLPNHHRALIAVVRLTEKMGTDQPKGMRPVECYFDTALRFARDDLVVHALYAEWLIKKKRLGEAEVHLDQLVKMAGNSPNIHYIAGLLYLQLEKFDKALQQAHRADELGWPRQELAEKLRAGGHWRDRPAAPGEPRTP